MDLNNWTQHLICPFEVQAIKNTNIPDLLTISTMTACIKLFNKKEQLIDFKKLHEYISTNKPIDIYNCTIIDSTTKGFAGQCTVIIKMDPTVSKPKKGTKINIKIFQNGSLQCTGINKPYTGFLAVYIIYNLCVQQKLITSPINMKFYKTVCINSNCKLPFKIERKEIYLILKNKYNVLTCFDLSEYPGVRVKFYFNSNNKLHNGHCYCYPDSTDICIAKKSTGYEFKSCRKISISIFHSGTILFSSSTNYEQLKIAFNYICFHNRLITVFRRETKGMAFF